MSIDSDFVIFEVCHRLAVKLFSLKFMLLLKVASLPKINDANADNTKERYQSPYSCKIRVDAAEVVFQKHPFIYLVVNGSHYHITQYDLFFRKYSLMKPLFLQLARFKIESPLAELA